jgi:hypothetical protein
MKIQNKVSMGWLAAISLLSVTTLCVASLATTAQRTGASQGLLPSDTFAVKQSGWMALGTGGAIRLTLDAAHVKTGKPALAFDYKVAPNQFVAAVLPVGTGSLARMTQLKFWLKTDSSTAVGVILSEKKPEGGNYNAIVWSPKDTWQQIELTPEDFAPSEGPSDPKDPDGKLDLDQIEGVGIIDLGEMFVNLSGKPELPIAVDQVAGAHTLYVDDFQALAETPPAASSKASASVVIDDFHRPSLNWLTLGGAELSRSSSGNPLGGPALEARYQQLEGKFVVIAHPLGHVDLHDTGSLSFDIASNKDAQIVVALEKRKPGSNEGPRYNTSFQVPGNRQVVHKSIPFAEFQLDENSPADPEGKLNPDQIKTVSLLDITAAFSHEQQQNTLWLGQLRAEPQPAGKGVQGQAGQNLARPSVASSAEPTNEGPMVMTHDEHSRVTGTMSHHMQMGPHIQMTDLRPANADDLKKADEIARTLRASIEKYKDYRVAMKDGFLPYMPNLRLPEYHFTNYGYAYQAAFRFDPAYPTSLLYKKTADGYQLVGAMYTAPDKVSPEALNARVPLSVARWHLHVNVCEPQGGMTERVNWLKFGPAGSIATEEACTEAGGKFMPHLFGWMVHVYPFEANSDSVWAR